MFLSAAKLLLAPNLLSIAVFVALASPTSAEGDPNICAAETDSLRRLDCFDRIFPFNQGDQRTENQATEKAVSKWVSNKDRSPIDDSPSFTALLEPTKASYTGIGDAEAYLIFSCRDNTTNVVITTNMFMVSDRVTVTTRVGDAPASSSKWARATNYKAVGLWSGSQSIPFLKALIDNSTLAIRIEEKDEVTAEYDLSDVSNQIGEIRSACNW